MTTAILAFLLASSASQASAAAAGGLSPAVIRADIDSHGARAVVEELWNNRQWELVEAHIAKGERAWIALAPSLAPGTDAGAAEGLGIALAEALPKRATAVLSVLDMNDGPVLGPSRICSMPFIEVSRSFLRQYKAAALAAVTKIEDTKLAQAKTACIERLTAS